MIRELKVGEDEAGDGRDLIREAASGTRRSARKGAGKALCR